MTEQPIQPTNKLQEWYTDIPAYQADAIVTLIRSAEQLIKRQERRHSATHDREYLIFRQVWKECVEALGGEVTNATF